MKKIFLLLFVILTIQINAQCIKSIAGGEIHTSIIKSDGTLWATGRNVYGQFGNGSTNLVNINIPTQIGLANDWQSIDAGWYYNLALKTDGTLWAWGRNNYGQLGNGSTIDNSSPTQVGTDNDWRIISAEYGNSYAIKTDGTLWAWGVNINGGLGDGTFSNRNIPTKIGTDTNWSTIEAGSEYALAIKTDGTLWSWGLNASGQIGNGTFVDTNTPVQIGTSNNWISIAAGYAQSFAIKTDGSLWGWGFNNIGQLGDGTTSNQNAPIQIGTATNWKSISTYAHSLAIKTDGTLWAWGRGNKGQLGNGSTSFDLTIPTQIGTNSNWKSVDVGSSEHTLSNAGYNSFAFKTDLSNWTWGTNSMGQLGLGDNAGRTTPTLFDCNTIGIKELISISPFQIYPNPVSDNIYIQNATNQTIDEIIISDALGRNVLEEKNNFSLININHIHQGVYIIVLSSEGKRYQTKFIKS